MHAHASPNFARARVGADVRKILRDHVATRGRSILALADDFLHVLSDRPRLRETIRGVRVLSIVDGIHRDRSASVIDVLVSIHNDLVATTDEIVALRAAQIVSMGSRVKVRCVGKVIGWKEKCIRYENDHSPGDPIVHIVPELVVPAWLGGHVFRAEALRRMWVS